VFTGSIAAAHWSASQAAQFQSAATLGGLVLTLVAAAFVGFGFVRARRTGQPAVDEPAVESVVDR
jgi:hypothetical protein